MAAGAVSLRKSHDIIILPICNIVKGQAKYLKVSILKVRLLVLLVICQNSKQIVCYLS